MQMEDRRPRRPYLKNHHPDWKDKLRQNCLKRIQEDRAHLIWKVRSTEEPVINPKVMPFSKGVLESALWDIVSDELKKMKHSSLNDCTVSDKPKKNHSSSNDCVEISIPDPGDALWEFDGFQMVPGPCEDDCVDLLIEMERALHEDLKAELIRKELESIERIAKEEDDYLARAVYEQMKLSDGEVGNDDKIWCPICRQGELRENRYIIYCAVCELQISVDSDKVNLEFLQIRLAEAHAEHIARGCRTTPKFCMETQFNLTALYIKCEVCNTFEVVA